MKSRLRKVVLKEGSVKVGMRKEDTLCRSKCSAGKHQIAADLR